jgi:hypothetical protein
LECAARLLDKLGHPDDGEKMAQFLANRYPDHLPSRMVLVSLDWQHGKNNEAAAILKAHPRKLVSQDWLDEIGPEFVSTFKNRPDEESLAAFSELVAAGFSPFDLVTITYRLAREQNNQLAYEMSSKLHTGGLGNVELLCTSYRYLKEWKSKEQAFDWLRQQIPASMTNASSMLFFQSKAYDLLWDFIRDPAPGGQGDFVWLLRAAD